jgi:hypothetical protein
MSLTDVNDQWVAGMITMYQHSAEELNARNAHNFRDAAESWQMNRSYWQSKGTPQEPPPIPMRVIVNVERTRKFLMALQGGGGQGDALVGGIYDTEPMSELAVMVQTTPAPAPVVNDPVLEPWGGNNPGMFKVTPGDLTKPGTIITHPKYGRLIKVQSETPFGTPVFWYESLSR